MATFNTLQQHSFTLCKYTSSLHTFQFQNLCHFLYFSPPKSTLRQVLPQIQAKLSTKDHETLTKIPRETSSAYNSSRSGDEEGETKSLENLFSSVLEGKSKKMSPDDKKAGKRGKMGLGRRREMGSGPGTSSLRPKETKKDGNDSLGENKVQKRSRKDKINSPGVQLRLQLDMCSKRGDVLRAIELYDEALREGIEMGQYHYAVLLYLCSSAAVGVVQPAKSGSGTRTVNMFSMNNEDSIVNGMEMDESESDKSRSQGDIDKMELTFSNRLDNLDNSLDEKKSSPQFSSRSIKPSQTLDDFRDEEKFQDDHLPKKDGNFSDQEDDEIRMSEDVKNYALQKGFKIFEKMCLDNVPMNEATLTAVARMAMSMGNGDMAFDMVKRMKTLGINPRLRSYGPALSAFCNSGAIDKAFAVEKHMLESGVYPEEPELEALLRVSIGAGKGDKVYYLLHKLRTSVRKVSTSTADTIIKWFESKAASRVGKRKLNQKLIQEAIENGGGGWHGQGWLGKGKWNIARTTVGEDALCKCCGEKLALIDLDPVETEQFAESVASLAIKREKQFSFQKFQKWLDYYGPFEAVVDAANVGLFSQRRFMPSKVNAVVNGIRQNLPSKKWPLIVLHNRRITGGKMDEPVNRRLIEKWKNADALYATPTGSNDDWYWLYAAIRFKCLIVTNDEMRDHTFQLLGNDFFPKWKERHQVHFRFSDAGPVFYMPPPCSVVIQESAKGHWHIPIESEHDNEAERTWLCILRLNLHVVRQDSATMPEDLKTIDHNQESARSSTRTEVNEKSLPLDDGNKEIPKMPNVEIYNNIRAILSGSPSSDHVTVLSEIEAAETLGNCVIDFQI